MHSCPDCGQACYCNGDIDDSPVDPTAADTCVHECLPDEDDDGSAAPLCRTSACAELGILAVNRFGWCTDCRRGLEEDAAEARAEAARERQRLDVDGGEW